MRLPAPLRLIWIGLSFLLCVSLHAADDVAFGPPSKWVKVAEPETRSQVTEHTSGLAYDLCDNQTNVSQGEDYSRIVARILSENGRSRCGELRFSFAPSYQTLTVHHLRILRDGQVLDRLDPKKIKLLSREQNAEQGLYDGRLTALVIVEDLRIGDVLDYALSVRGENPVFADKYSDSWSMQGGSPIQRMRVRVLFPENRSMRRRALGPVSGDPTIVRHDGMIEWTWDRKELAGVDYEYGAPDWFVQYPVQQVTEHTDWASVAKWGQALYPMDVALPKELETFIASLATKTPEEGVLAALHRVQSEIRYLSLSLGESSHRPHLPAEIFANRFGDCKDKAYLLTVLLRRMGFDAAPAFVNTNTGKGLADWLPSGKMFDHVIVHLRFEDDDYWLDPTRIYQAGKLADHSVTHLAWALPLRQEGTGLRAVLPTAKTKRQVQIEDNYVSSGSTKPVALSVRRVYRGASAESMRAYLADNTPERVGKEAINRFLRMYPSVQQSQEPRWTDDKASNAITLIEQYSIPDFWKHDAAEGTYRCEVLPLLLNDMMDAPDRPNRTTPMDYGEPFEVDSRIIVQLHEDIAVTPVAWTEKTEAFEFEKSNTYSTRRFEVKYLYKTTADSVAPEKMTRFVQQLAGIRERIGYTLTLGGKTASFVLNWSGLFIVMLVAVAGLYGAFRLYRWQRTDAPPPLPQPYDPSQIYMGDSYVGLGGWLILVGIGLSIGVVVSLYQLPGQLKPVLDLSVWSNVTTPSSSAYHSAYAPLLLGEAVYNVLRVIAVVLAAVLYFRKHWLFPRLMIILLAGSPIALMVDSWAASFVVKTELAETTKLYSEVIRGVFSACIWIPYYVVSKRVKATFVR